VLLGSLAVVWAHPTGPQHCPSSPGSLCHLPMLEKHLSTFCAGLVLYIVLRKKYQMQTVILFSDHWGGPEET